MSYAVVYGLVCWLCRIEILNGVGIWLTGLTCSLCISMVVPSGGRNMVLSAYDSGKDL